MSVKMTPDPVSKKVHRLSWWTLWLLSLIIIMDWAADDSVFFASSILLSEWYLPIFWDWLLIVNLIWNWQVPSNNQKSAFQIFWRHITFHRQGNPSGVQDNEGRLIFFFFLSFSATRIYESILKKRRSVRHDMSTVWIINSLRNWSLVDACFSTERAVVSVDWIPGVITLDACRSISWLLLACRTIGYMHFLKIIDDVESNIDPHLSCPFSFVSPYSYPVLRTYVQKLPWELLVRKRRRGDIRHDKHSWSHNTHYYRIPSHLTKTIRCWTNGGSPASGFVACKNERAQDVHQSLSCLSTRVLYPEIMVVLLQGMTQQATNNWSARERRSHKARSKIRFCV